MDGSWVNIHPLDNGYANQRTSIKQTLADVTASSDSSGFYAQSNSNGDNEAARRARDKAYKNKSRQKEADKKKLLDLKNTLNESEAKLYKRKWDDVKSAIHAGSRSSSCAQCHVWLQEVLATADNVDADKFVQEKLRAFEEQCLEFASKYGVPFEGGRSASCTQSGMGKVADVGMEAAHASSAIKAEEPNSKKPRTSGGPARWKYCPWCGHYLYVDVCDASETGEPADSNHHGGQPVPYMPVYGPPSTILNQFANGPEARAAGQTFAYSGYQHHSPKAAGTTYVSESVAAGQYMPASGQTLSMVPFQPYASVYTQNPATTAVELAGSGPVEPQIRPNFEQLISGNIGSVRTHFGEPLVTRSVQNDGLSSIHTETGIPFISAPGNAQQRPSIPGYDRPTSLSIDIRSQNDVRALGQPSTTVNPINYVLSSRHAMETAESIEDVMKLFDKCKLSEGKELCIVKARSDVEELEMIAEGTFGSIRRIRHRPSSQEMAMKSVLRNGADSQRFLREIKTLQAIRCEYILEFFGAFSDSVLLHLVTELMDLSMDKLLGITGFVLEEQLRWIVFSVLHAVGYLEKDLNTLHRDIKPSHILANRFGQVKLCGFSMSCILEDGLAEEFCGTVLYMSPERIEGKPHSVLAEVWSIGITLVELGTGRYPYPPATDADIAMLMRKICLFQDNNYEKLRELANKSYAESKSSAFELVFERLVYETSPSLPENIFGDDVRDFVSRSLAKEASDRASIDALMQHNFLSAAKSSPEETRRLFASFIATVLNMVEPDEEVDLDEQEEPK